ncbi:TraR/DksA C4-type zinc finger protein [Neisseriaceae bacterium B1]
MTDFIDQACEAEGIFLEEALAKFRQPETVRESALHCWECGEPIPEARRLAMRGCTLCVFCQEESEKHG